MQLTQKKRGVVTRKRTPIILINTEGNNKTENNYLRQFKEHRNFRIKFIKSNITDPVKMVEQIQKEIKDLSLNPKDGDKAFCIFDTDFRVSKQEQINKAIELSNKTKLIDLIISNPAVEFWFLIHFKKTTKCFNSHNELIKELKKYLLGYEKNKDFNSILSDKMDVAIKNAKEIESYQTALR